MDFLRLFCTIIQRMQECKDGKDTFISLLGTAINNVKYLQRLAPGPAFPLPSKERILHDLSTTVLLVDHEVSLRDPKGPQSLTSLARALLTY